MRVEKKLIQTKLLRVAVVLLVFVSQLGNFILVEAALGHPAKVG